MTGTDTKELNTRLAKIRKRRHWDPIEPLMWFQGARRYPIWAHRAELVRTGTPDKPCYVKCRYPGGCDFGGKYPTVAHARQILDLHEIRTHVTGAEFCGMPGCVGDAAIKRKAARDRNPA